MDPHHLPDPDGNVEIHFGNGEVYYVRSQVLEALSPWFKRNLAPYREQKVIYELRFGGELKYGFLYMKEPVWDLNDAVSLTDNSIMETLDMPGLEALDGPPGSRDSTERNTFVRLRRILGYEFFFLAIYHVKATSMLKAIEQNCGGSAVNAFRRVFGVLREALKIAKYYECKDVVALRIPYYFQRYRHGTLEACADRPLHWLKAGETFNSPFISSEAATYILGMCHAQWNQCHTIFEEMAVEAFFTGRRQAFVNKIEACERDLFRIQGPANSAGVRDAYCQVANQSFRNFLIDHQRRGFGSQLGPCYARMYRLLATRDIRVLQRSAEPLLGVLPADQNGNRATIDALRPYLQVIINEAADIIEPLLVEKTRLNLLPPLQRPVRFDATDDPARYNTAPGDTAADNAADDNQHHDTLVKYFNMNLLCMEVSEEELPWVKNEV